MESIIGLRFSGAPFRVMLSGFHAASRADHKPQFRRLSCSSGYFSPRKLETAAAPPPASFDRQFPLLLSRSPRRLPLDHIVGPVRCTAAQSGSGENRQQKQNQCKDLVLQLVQRQPGILADLLKESLAKKDFHLYNQIIDIVDDEVKNPKNHDLALQLLKISEECIRQDTDSLDAVRFKIMEIFYTDGKYVEAFDYWVKLCETESLQMRKKLFLDMQRDLFSSVRKVGEWLKRKLCAEKPEKLRSINGSLASITELEENMSQIYSETLQRLKKMGDVPPNPEGFPNFNSSGPT